MDLADVLSNPVRTKIVQCLQFNKEATTKQIAAALTDVPAPTVYRHVSFLLKEGVLTVVSENKVRGTTERLLALNEDFWSPKTGADLDQAAFQFLASLYRGFHEYCSAGGRDPEADMLCLRTCVFRLTDERFGRFIEEYAELVERYREEDGEGSLRSVSFISAPVKEEERA
ncbi:MAG: helix-turn-helix domain-containing protein [Candidatus Methanomethylophilaceae archaeon]|nr:helix-turn-helix domain-containing protein [Candidatus Methanomethylophilaceae archaeon]